MIKPEGVCGNPQICSHPICNKGDLGALEFVVTVWSEGKKKVLWGLFPQSVHFEKSMSIENFQMFKLYLEMVEEPEIKLTASIGSSKKQESSRRTSASALLTMSKPLTVCITTNHGTFLKRWEYQTTWPISWEICMQVKKQQLELDMNNGLAPDWERSTWRLYIVTLLI